MLFSERPMTHEPQSYVGSEPCAKAGEPQASRRLRELEALFSISSAIHASLDLNQVLDHALGQVLEVFSFPAGALRLLDATTGELVFTMHRELSPDLAAKLCRPLRIGGGPGGLAARERAIVVMDELAREYAGSIWARHGFRTLVEAPLLCRGMLLGCLNLATCHERPGGSLRVRLDEATGGLLLRVDDDGPGLPQGFELSRDASVGLQVVRTLAERNLAGKLTLSQGPGLVAQVWFPQSREKPLH